VTKDSEHDEPRRTRLEAPPKKGNAMTEIPVAVLRKNLADALNRARYKNEIIKITHNGKLCAALVSPEDAELLISLREEMSKLLCTE
jgi:hypothetical protein